MGTVGHDGHGNGRDSGSDGWDTQLLELLEYRVVLGVLMTTLDGLVIAHAGLTAEDAELLAATQVAPGNDEQCSAEQSGCIHTREGAEMRLIVLTERDASNDAIAALMIDHLAQFEESLAA